MACVAVSDAPAALILALRLAGVGPGDEVAVSALACTASVMPIAALGARPVWTDVDPLTGMPSPRHLAEVARAGLKAFVLYHWSGDVGDLSGLGSVCRAQGIALIQDASEAWGASCLGQPLGAAGADATVLSFYATRLLSTGEGGALLVGSPDLAARARRLRRFGIDQTSFRLPSGDLNPDSDIPEAGYGFQMGTIAATLGLRQLERAEERVARHRSNGRHYDAALRGVAGLTLLTRPPDRVSAYWTYAMRAERRADLLRMLHERGIGAQRLHLRVDRYGCFDGCRSSAGDGVDIFDSENVAIPCGWWMSPDDCEEVAACLRRGW